MIKKSLNIVIFHCGYVNPGDCILRYFLTRSRDSLSVLLPEILRGELKYE